MRSFSIQPFILLLSAAMLVGGVAVAQDLSSSSRRFEGGGTLDVPAMASKAHVIARGVISGAQAKWVNRTLFTEYTLQVQEALKGPAQSTLTMSVMGGSLGSVELVIPGAPQQLETGAEVVFFGERFDAGQGFKPVGLFDGVVQVKQAAGIGASVAPRGKPESLADFLDEVRGLGRNR